MNDLYTKIKIENLQNLLNFTNMIANYEMMCFNKSEAIMHLHNKINFKQAYEASPSILESFDNNVLINAIEGLAFEGDPTFYNIGFYYNYTNKRIFILVTSLSMGNAMVYEYRIFNEIEQAIDVVGSAYDEFIKQNFSNQEG